MSDDPKNQPTGLTLVATYFILWLVNGLVIFIANSFYPQEVVLGTAHISPFWAIVHSMGALALINTFAIPFVRWYEKRQGKMFTTKEWLMFYFLVNFAGVWLVARFADQLGFGIRSWSVAAVLAIILDLTQGVAMMQIEKFREKIP